MTPTDPHVAAERESGAKQAKEDAGIATATENSKLKHSEDLAPELYGAGDALKAGKRPSATTRDDSTDAGVPMLQGPPDEPQGPEDAFGPGPKRGDYSQRTGGVNSMVSVPVEGGGQPIVDGDGNIVDYTPHSVLVPQTPRASVQGEVAGAKGGVDTTDDDL